MPSRSHDPTIARSYSQSEASMVLELNSKSFFAILLPRHMGSNFLTLCAPTKTRQQNLARFRAGGPKKLGAGPLGLELLRQGLEVGAASCKADAPLIQHQW